MADLRTRSKKKDQVVIMLVGIVLATANKEHDKSTSSDPYTTE